jgi:diguanylate cyclase (GGDEF)-like protein
MLLRVDNYHDVRARYGRFLAERLLRQVGSELEAAMRDTDFLGAYHDDGFAAILVEADAEQAQLARKRLTRGLVDVQIPNAGIEDLTSQLSCATASTPDDGEEAPELFAAAEARLDGEDASLQASA